MPVAAPRVRASVRSLSWSPRIDECREVAPEHFVGGAPERSFCGGIGQPDAQVQIQLHDRIERAIYETVQLLLAFAHAALDPEAPKLGRRTIGKDV